MLTRKVEKNNSRVRSFLIGACLLLIVVVGGYFAYGLLIKNDGLTSFNPSLVKLPDQEEVQVQAVQYERKIYPYSIVRGGMRSRDEVYANIRTDHVVAEHYSDFNVDETRLIQAPETRSMYVSYRLGDEVYWTANAVQIPQGEALITDGTLEARARCGNMISATPMTPTSDKEPDEAFFDIPDNDTPLYGYSEPEQFIESEQTPLSQFPIGVSSTPLSGGNAPLSNSGGFSPLGGSGGFSPLGNMPNDTSSQYLPGIPVAQIDPGVYNPVLPPGKTDLPGTSDGPGSPYMPPGTDGPGSPYMPPGTDGPGSPYIPPVMVDLPDLNGVETVPEPGSMVLFITGLAAFAIIRTRRQK